MRIEELTPGVDITFYVNISNEQQLTFESKIIASNPQEHFAVAAEFAHDSRSFSLNAQKDRDISIDMVALIPDEKPIWFQDITMKMINPADIKLPQGQTGYQLTSKKQGIPYNRRNHFRCFIGNSTYLTSIGNEDAPQCSVFLNDVSASGFSITCDSSLQLEHGQLVHVLLEDRMEGTNRVYSFNLFGVTMRRQDLENGKITYGFKLSSRIGGLENYLLQKERARSSSQR